MTIASHRASMLATGALLNAIPDIANMPADALLTDQQKSLHSGFSVEALKKWRREGRGPDIVYVEGRPRSTVAAYRAWLARATASAS